MCISHSTIPRYIGLNINDIKMEKDSVYFVDGDEAAVKVECSGPQ